MEQLLLGSMIELRLMYVLRARARRDDIKALYIRAGGVTPTDSHKRQLAADQFRAPRNIQCRGSRPLIGWTRDDEAVDVQAAVQDDMQMVPKTEVPHPFETTEVPHSSETEALTAIEISPRKTIEVSAMDDV
ncbi:unnamed protein product [Vicia faba]|uniref:Uncharacterized protein n=1 Tax=Vicia faba TaxID=3906 RepID=A0AAV1A169_VICFA|nr:unnamed protein product [Vicia faba]